MNSQAEQLREALLDSRARIEAHVVTTEQEWRWALAVLEKVSAKDPEEVYDEKLWTWLLACGYAEGGASGVQLLGSAMTGGAETGDAHHRIWFEAQPPSPRRGEGNTHLDLALGDLVPRDGTHGGVQSPLQPSWICFCEMKWYSDLSSRVTNDLHRNQLARVIENALAFSADPLPSTHVSLVTPGCFREARSRFYAYKFEEYERDASAVLADLQRCRLEPTYRIDDLEARVDGLRLHWITFDEVFHEMPCSDLTKAVRAFRDRFDATRPG